MTKKVSKKDLILYLIVSLQFVLLVLFFIKTSNSINNLKRALMLESHNVSVLQYKVMCLEGEKDACKTLKIAEQARNDFNEDFYKKKVIEPWYKLSF